MSNSGVPVQNIYHMLCYAWGALEQRDLVNISSIDASKPVDLLAKVLVTGTQSLVRRGIARDYVLNDEMIAGVRGKPNLPYSARRLMLKQGKVRCEYDELSEDILANQVLLATLKRLLRCSELNKTIRKDLKGLILKLGSVETISLYSSVFKSVQIHSNNRFYRFLMDVCELVYQESLLDEESGEYRFRDFYREDGAMARLFEKFILNFYRKEQGKFSVSSEQLRWDAFSSDDPELKYLPSMFTDISLKSVDHEIVMDAKYYRDIFIKNHGVERIRSGHIYQISAYLENLNSNCKNVEGMLIYPVVDKEASLKYQLNDKCIRIETIDLSRGWSHIESKLLELVNAGKTSSLVA